MARRDQGRMEHQIRTRFCEMFNRGKGTSKHRDKAKNRGKPLKDKIYSVSTLNRYIRACRSFSRYAAERGCRNMEQARALVPCWLEERIRQGCSAYTLGVEASALAKYYGCGKRDFGVKLPKRRIQDIKLHRDPEKWKGRFSPEKNSDLVAFCLASGARKEDCRQVRAEDVELGPDGRAVVLFRRGKGGKDRLTHCLSDQPYRLAQSAIGEGRELIFPKVPHEAPCHFYRAEYAKARYRELARDLQEIPRKQIYYCRGVYRGNAYDKLALAKVSKDLGHTRLDVVVEHYLLAGVLPEDKPCPAG